MTKFDADAVFGAEVFKHTPELRGRIIPPEASNVRLSYERFAEYDRLAAEENWPADYRMDHDKREENRRAVLKDRLDKPLWIFAYGSLIWDPGTYIDQIRRARLPGWHRSFCMKIEGGRGRPQQPGLMLALDQGGACQGTVFRIAADLVDRETEILWMREMFAGTYRPVILPVETPQGPVEAVVFVIDRQNRRYMPDLSLDDTARIVARAEGNLGSNFDYLDQLVGHLLELGMEDPAMTELHARASQIRTLGAMITRSTLTCPECGHASEQDMPTDACQWFFDCPACQALLKPKPGDCCVFCSYGSVPCPPVQAGDGCCS